MIAIYLVSLQPSWVMGLKIMIYLHWDCNRYCELSIKFVLNYKTMISHVFTTINYAFLPLRNKGLCRAVCKETCQTLLLLQKHIFLSNCAYIHCLVSVNAQPTSMNANDFIFFSVWSNSMTNLCFISTFMLDAILPVYHSVFL